MMGNELGSEPPGRRWRPSREFFGVLPLIAIFVGIGVWLLLTGHSYGVLFITMIGNGVGIFVRTNRSERRNKRG
jgi:hypothetical protein